MNDIRMWREVIVAMLKPNTDFGWHTGGHDDGDFARSFNDGDDDITDSTSESKTVLQIHDVGDGAIEMSPIRGHQEKGSILQHVANHLKSDPEVVRKAVWRDRGEMIHASEELKGDKAFVLSAIEVSSGGAEKVGDVEMLDNPMGTPRTPMAATWHSTTSTLYVRVTLKSRDTLYVKVSPFGGRVTRVRMMQQERGQSKGEELTSIVRVGDTLAFVGDLPVTDATTHAEVGAMLRNAAYPVVLRFNIPAELHHWEEEEEEHV